MVDRAWSQLSPDERLERRWAAFVDPGLEFVSPDAAAEYRARATRLKKAILLEGEPDRVPVCVLAGYYPATRKGLYPYDVMHDYDLAAKVWLECNHDLQADSLIAPVFAAIPARAYELLDVKILGLPGHGAPREAGFQYNEKEWMQADEYDLLIDDPTDYLLHYYLPRVAGGLEGFSKLASPLDMVEIVAGPPWMMRWADPDVQASLEKLAAAGRECGAWGGTIYPLLGRLVAEGFPGSCHARIGFERHRQSGQRRTGAETVPGGRANDIVEHRRGQALSGRSALQADGPPNRPEIDPAAIGSTDQSGRHRGKDSPGAGGIAVRGRRVSAPDKLLETATADSFARGLGPGAGEKAIRTSILSAG